MSTGIKVGDCMQSTIVTISPDSRISEAAAKMRDEHVGSLLVKQKDKLVGIVTERDMVTRALATGKSNLLVKDVYTPNLLTIDIGEDLAIAAKIMGEKNVKRLVVTQSGKPSGIISQKDIISISPSLYDLIATRQDVGSKSKFKVF